MWIVLIYLMTFINHMFKDSEHQLSEPYLDGQ